MDYECVVLWLSRTVGIGAWVGVQCNLSFCDMELPWRQFQLVIFVLLFRVASTITDSQISPVKCDYLFTACCSTGSLCTDLKTNGGPVL